MTGFEGGEALTWVAFVGQFAVLGWVLGPAPIRLLQKGLVAIGWRAARPSIHDSRRIAVVLVAAGAAVELVRRLRCGEPVTVEAFPAALGGVALFAGALAPERATLRRGDAQVRAQLLGAGGVVLTVALQEWPVFRLVLAGLVAGVLVGLSLIATADWHLVRNRVRPLLSWTSISEPAAREPWLAVRRLLILTGVVPGVALGGILALREPQPNGPSWVGAVLAGALAACIAGGILLAHRQALRRRLVRALRAELPLDQELIRDARALLLATALAWLLVTATTLLLTAPGAAA